MPTGAERAAAVATFPSAAASDGLTGASVFYGIAGPRVPWLTTTNRGTEEDRMLRKWRAEGGRAGGTGAPFWVAALLFAVALSALGAQERDRDRDWRRFERPLTRLQGDAMSRALLGIRLSTRPADADAQGAEVRGVAAAGPADEAGIREGDIITQLDGQSLLEPLADAELEERVDAERSVPSQRLLLLARGLEAGREVVVGYVRDGQTAEVSVEPQVRWMGRRFEAARAREAIERARGRAREMMERIRIPGMGPGAPHGIGLTTLNPELGRYFGAESGALVTAADEDNPLGLEAGDVILSIDGRTVDSAADARRILRSYEEGEEMTLTIMRERAEMQLSGAVQERVRLRRRGAMRGAPFAPAGPQLAFLNYEQQQRELDQARREVGQAQQEVERALHEIQRELDEAFPTREELDLEELVRVDSILRRGAETVRLVVEQVHERLEQARYATRQTRPGEEAPGVRF